MNAIENYVEGHNGSATIYCNHDNAVSVQPLQMVSYFKHCQMDNDLNTTILYESATSPIIFNFKEVEGRAGKHPMFCYEDAEQQVRRNIDAGWGAKLFLETANSDRCDLTPLLPQQKAGLYVCALIITTDLDVRNRLHTHGQQMVHPGDGYNKCT